MLKKTLLLLALMLVAVSCTDTYKVETDLDTYSVTVMEDSSMELLDSNNELVTPEGSKFFYFDQTDGARVYLVYTVDGSRYTSYLGKGTVTNEGE